MNSRAISSSSLIVIPVTPWGQIRFSSKAKMTQLVLVFFGIFIIPLLITTQPFDPDACDYYLSLNGMMPHF
jgi:hypothetical protein